MQALCFCGLSVYPAVMLAVWLLRNFDLPEDLPESLPEHFAHVSALAFAHLLATCTEPL